MIDQRVAAAALAASFSEGEFADQIAGRWGLGSGLEVSPRPETETSNPAVQERYRETAEGVR